MVNMTRNEFKYSIYDEFFKSHKMTIAG